MLIRGGGGPQCASSGMASVRREAADPQAGLTVDKGEDQDRTGR